MINVLIVDDEEPSRLLLDNLLAKELSTEYVLVDSCKSIQEAVKSINENHVDLVFLDIHMPDEDGFELFKYFKNPDFHVVFVTAYDQHAIKAFNCSALHYLLKPLDNIQLGQAIARYKVTNQKHKGLEQKLDVLAEHLGDDKAQKRVVFGTPGGFDVIVVSDILYVKADQNYCDIHMVDKSKKVVSATLKNIEERLPDTFFCRIHHGYIINLNKVDRYIKADREVVLTNGAVFKISERKLRNFLNRVRATV